MEKQSKIDKESGQSYLSLIGGIIALVCFFGPWAGCDRMTVSGADIASQSGQYYLILGGSVVIIISFLFFKFRNELSKSKIFIVISSIISLGLILVKAIDLQNKGLTDYIELKWGGVGTIIGFVLSLIGIAFLTDNKVLLDKSVTKGQVLFCSSCGKKQDDITGDFCEECGNKLH